MNTPKTCPGDPTAAPLAYIDNKLIAEALAQYARSLDSKTDGCGDDDAADCRWRADRVRSLAARFSDLSDRK